MSVINCFPACWRCAPAVQGSREHSTLMAAGSGAGTAKSPTPPGCFSRSKFPHAALQESAVGSLGLYTCAVHYVLTFISCIAFYTRGCCWWLLYFCWLWLNGECYLRNDSEAHGWCDGSTCPYLLRKCSSCFHQRNCSNSSVKFSHLGSSWWVLNIINFSHI